MIMMREADPDDAMTILAWRNNPRIFENSRIAEPVELEEHISWYARSLVSDKCHILIAEEDGDPVGMIRLDERMEGDYEVSIIVDPHYQGRGFGSHMLALVCNCESGALTADIKATNLASRRIFEKCGFRQIFPEGDFVLYRRDRKL
jgi:RimJ/RimL family protein N-acetyltransferase